MKEEDPNEKLKKAVRFSNKNNPEFYFNYSNDIGQIKKQLTELERDTGSISNKVDKMYFLMTSDSENGHVGILKQVQIHAKEINDNYKALSELRKVLELDSERRKAQDLPNRVLNNEIQINELNSLNKKRDLIEDIRRKKDEEFKRSIANKQKTIVLIISTIWVVLTFIINIYFDKYV